MKNSIAVDNRLGSEIFCLEKDGDTAPRGETQAMAFKVALKYSNRNLSIEFGMETLT